MVDKRLEELYVARGKLVLGIKHAERLLARLDRDIAMAEDSVLDKLDESQADESPRE